MKDIEAQKQDKMGALIDFLLAAGASGGTNLGATLTGGGSGLRAREARLNREQAEAMKNIEDLQFRDRQLSSEERRAQQTIAATVMDRLIGAPPVRVRLMVTSLVPSPSALRSAAV